MIGSVTEKFSFGIHAILADGLWPIRAQKRPGSVAEQLVGIHATLADGLWPIRAQKRPGSISEQTVGIHETSADGLQPIGAKRPKRTRKIDQSELRIKR